MKYIIYIIILLIIWLLLTFNFTWTGLLVGAVVSVLSVFFFGKYFMEEAGKLLNPIRYYWLIIYVFIFSWECLKANFDVAYRVLHPKLPIKPGIVKVKITLETDIARTTLANSITMTPGTITVDIVDDYIYVHWIYVSTTDPEKYTHKIAGRFENYIRKIFE